jgi:hypothetical protein
VNVVRAVWRHIPEDVRNAAWLLPAVTSIYAALYPLMDFPSRHH